MNLQSCGRNEEDCGRDEKANKGMMMKTGKKLWHIREQLVKKCGKINKHCQRHNGPRILSPKLELSLKAETNTNSNLVL